MTDERDLIRLIEGDCSPEEAVAIQAWVVADPRRIELLDELRALWRLTGGGTDAAHRWDVAAARQRLRRARAAGRPGSGAPQPQRYARPNAPAWARRVFVAATVVAIGVGVGTLVGGRGRSAAQGREYATAPGRRATVSLADGTRIQLSVDTRLRVAPGYGAGERAVELDGEAYFVVRHDPRRPFIVRTQRGTARDLGTEFAVRAYRQEPYLQVVVATDSVALQSATGGASAALTLRPRDRGVVDERGRVSVDPGVPLERYVGWTRGRLVFDDTPLAAVAAQLGRWYDLDVRLADPSLGDEHVTITFAAESADEALSALAKVLDLRVTRAGRSVRLATAPRPRSSASDTSITPAVLVRGE